MNKKQREEFEPVMQLTRYAFDLYSVLRPDWLANFESIKDDRLSFVNEYIKKHATVEQRQIMAKYNYK